MTSLRDADLRHSGFENCDFTGADVAGAKLTKETAEALQFSSEQQLVIDAQKDDGEEPDGG